MGIETGSVMVSTVQYPTKVDELPIMSQYHSSVNVSSENRTIGLLPDKAEKQKPEEDNIIITLVKPHKQVHDKEFNSPVHMVKLSLRIM